MFIPSEKAKQIIEEKYGSITYNSFSVNESLDGLVATRDLLFKVASKGQKYEFGSYGRPILDESKLVIEQITPNNKPISYNERIARRKKYIQAAQISGPVINDYSLPISEWGDNIRTELRTRKLREIYVLCNTAPIPVWICDTLEPVLNWGECDQLGLQQYLRKYYENYLGLPLYRIPPLNLSAINLSTLPKTERDVILKLMGNNFSSFAQQMTALLAETLRIFNLNPLIIDQNRLREAGAYDSGLTYVLRNKEKFEEIFGKDNLVRVECPKCKKYVFSVTINNCKVTGVCNGCVRSLKDKELERKFDGCGHVFEEDLYYLYRNSLLNGKLLTSLYMSNSDLGIFFPDYECMPENIITGEIGKILISSGKLFSSGIPKIVKTARMTLEDKVANVFDLLDALPKDEIVKRMESTPSFRALDFNRKFITAILLNKLKKYGFPTDPNLIADVIYSLGGCSINFDLLGLSKIDKEKVFQCLACLGRVRRNRVLIRKPAITYAGGYKEYMFGKRVDDKEIDRLRQFVARKEAVVKEIMDLCYIGSIVN